MRKACALEYRTNSVSDAHLLKAQYRLCQGYFPFVFISLSVSKGIGSVCLHRLCIIHQNIALEGEKIKTKSC